MRKQKSFEELRASRQIAVRVKEYNELLETLSRAQKGIEGTYLQLKTKTAKDAAKLFARQTHLIFNMLLLPSEISIFSEGRAEGLTEAFTVVLDTLRRVPSARERATSKKETEAAKRKKMQRAANAAMANFFALAELRGAGSIRPWLFATTVYIWTAFECLAADLWEDTLNKNAVPLGHKVLSSLQKGDPDEGFSGQTLRIGLVAKYGFDLRHCLGTLLKSRFDFTSVGGILKAYDRTFGACQKLEALQGNLKELEQIRNLIVHRGGVVDDRFLTLTKIRAKRGTELVIKLSQITNYLVAATLGAVALLKLADEWDHKTASNRVNQRDQAKPPKGDG
jgi:hypothetical protein